MPYHLFQCSFHHIMVPSSRLLFILVFTAIQLEEVYSRPHLKFTQNNNLAEYPLTADLNKTAKQQINETNTNETLYIDFTHFTYIDFHRIGFNIFVRKLLEALRILDFFLKIDPMLVKVAGSYKVINEKDYKSNNTTNFTSDTKSGFEYFNNESGVETTTESPIKINSTENPMLYTDNQSPLPVNITESGTPTQHQDEIENKPKGFFSSVASKVASIFNGFIDWF